MRLSSGCTIVAFIMLLVSSAAGLPNFVVLFVDDMGIDQIDVPTPHGVYGYTGNNHTIHTPNLAKLASEGLLFQTWYSSFHVCSPSRASIMTGRYSIRSGIGIPNSKYAPGAPGGPISNLVFTAEAVGGLPLNETTTAEALKGAGYATAMIGKWHLGSRAEYLPTARGFDHYLGIPFSQDMGLSFWLPHNYEPSLPYQPTPLPLLNGTKILEQPAALETLVSKYTDSAVGFITQSVREQTPFYLYMSYNHIHAPNSCGSSFCGASTRGPIGDAVEEMDWSVGHIMNSLKAVGVDNNTLVIFTSDNGSPQRPDGNHPLRGFKGQTWEGGFREPAIARWLGKIHPGAVTQAIGSTLDIHPTILSLAGVKPAAEMDGQDLSPILFADHSQRATQSLPGHASIFFYQYAVASDAANALSAVRVGDYKCYYFTVGDRPPLPYKPGRQSPPLLFNLVADPSESHPIHAKTDEYASAMAVITKAKAEHLKSIQPVPNQNARGSMLEYSLCDDPASQQKYPQWPNCTTNPENWVPKSICTSQSCLIANPKFKAACSHKSVAPLK